MAEWAMQVGVATTLETQALLALGGGLAFGVVNSLHCVGMCGPLVATVHARGGAGGFGKDGVGKGGAAGRSAMAMSGYHAARTMSYATLGAVVGMVGGAMHAEALHGYGAGFALFCAVLMLVVAFVPKGRISRHIPWVGQVTRKVTMAAQSMPRTQRSVALGLVTPLLPCGLLYAALVIAAATAHPLGGAATMVGFGLGAVPAMVFATWNFEHVRVRFGARAAQRLGQVAMVLAAVMLAWRGFAAWTAGPAACCAHG